MIETRSTNFCKGMLRKDLIFLCCFIGFNFRKCEGTDFDDSSEFSSCEPIVKLLEKIKVPERDHFRQPNSIKEKQTARVISSKSPHHKKICTVKVLGSDGRAWVEDTAAEYPKMLEVEEGFLHPLVDVVNINYYEPETWFVMKDDYYPPNTNGNRPIYKKGELVQSEGKVGFLEWYKNDEVFLRNKITVDMYHTIEAGTKLIVVEDQGRDKENITVEISLYCEDEEEVFAQVDLPKSRVILVQREAMVNGARNWGEPSPVPVTYLEKFCSRGILHIHECYKGGTYKKDEKVFLREVKRVGMGPDTVFQLGVINAEGKKDWVCASDVYEPTSVHYM